MSIRKQYMRDEKRNKIGVMVAITDGTHIYLGFSKCNLKHDRFDRAIGTQMAIGRARKYDKSSFEQVNEFIHESTKPQVSGFIKMVQEKNTDSTFPTWASYFI